MSGALPQRVRRFVRRRRTARTGSGHAGLEARLVWIFGSPRTGSTWLLNLMGLGRGVVKVDEPAIGQHLALLMPDVFGRPASSFPLDGFSVPDARRGDDDYFFSARYRDVWGPRLRDLVLDRFAAQAEDRAPGGRGLLVIKEPNGSQGAAMLLDVLPASRAIFLVRDGRDVVDSQLDAARAGGWLSRYGDAPEMTAKSRLEFVEDRSWRWRHRMDVVQAAYERHAPDRRFLLRYEDLRADTGGRLRELFAWLGLDAGRADLDEKIAAASFEALPEDQKGPGRFARAAAPGLWRESLSREEQELAERIMGEALVRLGYEL